MGRAAEIACAVVAALGTAHAQPKKQPTRADETFERGRALMGKRDWKGACDAFEQSLVLDFRFGTLFNIASCDEKLGKLASALEAYRKISHDDHDQTRRASANQAIAKLEPRVPRVTIAITGKPPDLRVVLDDTPVDDMLGTEIHVDVGAHQIKASATGHADQVKLLDVKEGELAQIALRFDDPIVIRRDPGPSKRALSGQITLAGGGVVLVTGLVLGGVALHDWHDAQTTAMTDPVAANQQVHTTRILGDVSTVMVIVSVAATATGLYLWRSDHATITPHVGADGGGVAVSGTF